MTPTSKPAVTPEMVEKARLAIARKLESEANPCIHRDDPAFCEYCDVQWLESLPQRMAEFAASAVQDAVSEMLPVMRELENIITDNFHCSPTDNCAECEIYRPIIAKAAALREKYGVKP